MGHRHVKAAGTSTIRVQAAMCDLRIRKKEKKKNPPQVALGARAAEITLVALASG